jgi:hypothetical protein
VIPESLGVHEHWTGPEEKKYSRNLGLSRGIELVSVRLNPPTPTAASLDFFRVSELGGRFFFEWRTLLETEVLGFVVERRLPGMLDWTPVTPRLIPSSGQAGRPTTYRMEAEASKEQCSSLFRLTAVDTKGRRRGLTEVTSRPGIRLTISSSPAGRITLDIAGPPAQMVSLESAGTPVDTAWMPLDSGITDSNGYLSFQLIPDPGRVVRFFRAIAKETEIQSPGGSIKP